MLYIKNQISEFESKEELSELEEKLSEIYKNIENEKYIDELIEKIKYKSVIKGICDKSKDEKSTNEFIEPFFIDTEVDSYEIKENYIIDAPIELHIIATLWVTIIGKKIDNKICEKSSYGNRLEKTSLEILEEDSIKKITELRNTNRLFKPYYIQYQAWRDKALKKVKHIMEDNNNAILFSMDIERFYYNINKDNFNISEKFKEFCEDEFESNLCKIIDKINNKYNNILKEELFLKTNSLPIGLLSSQIISNYSLINFDSYVLENLNPIYYGRYVDDIILIFKIENKFIKDSTKELIENFYRICDSDKKNKKIRFEIENKENCLNFICDEYEKLKFSNKKIKVHIFKKNETKALIDIFNKKIRETASVFNVFSEDEELINSFNKNALEIQYEGSLNKINGIKGLQEDKFILSVFLTKAIMENECAGKGNKDKFLKEVKDFFKGEILIKYSFLWEKLFTYYLSRDSYKEMENLYFNIIDEIDKIKKIETIEEVVNKEKILEKSKRNLKEFLKMSFELTCALNILIYEKFKKINRNELDKRKENSKKYIKSNMLRHFYINSTLVNFLDSKGEINFLENQNFELYKEKKISELKLQYSPRFIQLDEFILYFFIKNHFEDNKNYIKESKEYFEKYSLKTEKNKIVAKVDSIKIDKEWEKRESPKVQIVEIKSGEKLQKVKIGLAIIDFSEENMIDNLKDKQNLSYDREQKINKILNRAREENVDFLIFPEITIPFSWLKKIIQFSRKNNIAVIIGVEHLKINGYAYNYMATILPMEYSKNYRTTRIDLRLKTHYAPAEEAEIISREIKIPEKEEKYNLFIWKGVFFTVFNCFELTNIRARAKFLGVIDLLVASEFNRDTNYFDEIIHSTSKDLSCYVIQSNLAKYGGISIVQPKGEYQKKVIDFKGAENINLVTGTIDIKSLREHQKKISMFTESGGFKPIPPNYKVIYPVYRENQNIKEIIKVLEGK